MAHWLCLDIATAGVENAQDFIDLGDISAPENYKDPAKIQAYCEGKRKERISRSGLDIDLARITAIGIRNGHGADGLAITTCQTEGEEREAISALALNLGYLHPQVLTFNGFQFDLLVLQRRARYLGLKFPIVNTDKYRSNNVDLLDVLTYRGAVARKSLGWYVKRLGWTDLVKPLSGEEEAQVSVTGRWDELRQSVAHDVEATYRLAQWLGVIEPARVEQEAGIF